MSDDKRAENAARLSRGILFACVIIVSVLPLIVFRGLANPFIFGRNAVLRSCVALSIVPLLVLWKYRPETRPRQSMLVWGVGSVVLFALLNAFHGIDTLRSLAGDLERADGVYTLVAFGIFFLVVQSVLRAGVRWEQLWDVQIAVGLLACLLAILRVLALQVLRTGNPESQLIGTLGNPAFFGEYALALLVCATMRLATTSGKHRWLHVFSVAIFSVTAVWSQIRGVLLGMCVAGAVFVVWQAPALRVWWRERTRQRLAPLLVFVLLVLVCGVVAVRAGSFSRIHALAHPLQESTVQQRFLLWNAMAEAFWQRPLLGWGSENEIAAFYAHVPPTLWFYTGEVFDRAHNVVFDILVSGGVVGVSVALFCVWAFLHTARRALQARVGDERRALQVGLCVLCGYAFSLLLLFHTQAASFVLVCFVSLVAVWGGDEDAAAVPVPGRAVFWPAPVLALLCVWVAVVQPVGAAVASARALQLLATDRDRALVYAMQSDAWHSVLSREYAKFFAGRLVAEGASHITDVPGWTRAATFAQRALIDAAARHPWDPSPLFVLAGLEDIWSKTEPVAAIAGLAHLERGVARHMESADGRLRLALLLTKAWQGRVAVQQLEAAAITTPGNPYWTRTLGLIHGLLGERGTAEAALQQTSARTRQVFPSQVGQTKQELDLLRNRIRGIPLMHPVPVL